MTKTKKARKEEVLPTKGAEEKKRGKSPGVQEDEDESGIGTENDSAPPPAKSRRSSSEDEKSHRGLSPIQPPPPPPPQLPCSSTEELAKEIKHVLRKIKAGGVLPDELDSYLASLRERSRVGYRVLLRVLQQQQEQQRKPSSKDKKKVVGEREEEEAEEEDIMDNEDLTLTEMPLSNADFLSLEEALNSGPFADFSGFDSTAAGLGSLLSAPPSPSQQQQQPQQQQQQQQQNLSEGNQFQQQQQQSLEQEHHQQQIEMQMQLLNQVGLGSLLSSPQQQQTQQQQSPTPQQQQQNQQQQTQSSRRRLPRTNTQDPERRARFSRTADILARSGLLDVTMRTAELMRRNEQLARDLAQLRRDADAFVRDVLSNPENAHLVNNDDNKTSEDQQQPPPSSASRVASPSSLLVTGASGVDFHLLDPESGQAVPMATRLLSSEGGNGGGNSTNKRKVEVLSEPMAFEDVDDITSLRQEDSKRDRIIA